jgi:uncharacterized protein
VPVPGQAERVAVVTRTSAHLSRMLRWRHWPLVTVVGFLAMVNVVSNRVLPDAAYVPFAFTVAVGLTWFAVRCDGLTARELGWDRTSRRAGLRWGLGLAALVAGVYLVGALLPVTRSLFEDARVADLDGAGVAYQALVRVPLGTVALEEVAFRSVLLAMLLSRLPTRSAVAASSVLFGLWHVLPAVNMGEVNPVVEDHLTGPGGAALMLAGGVVGTAAAGVVFSWLRLRTGSVLPPMLVHWATNGLGYVAAWLVLSS